MSALFLAYRTELVKQEPPGRSTNSTAGPSPTAARSRSVRSSVPQPSFETGVRTSSSPVIVLTAVTRASATAAWETITPRSGVLLIVFLEIVLHLALVAHTPDEPLVEGGRGVHAGVAQQVIHRDDFANDREVLAGVERHRHQRQRHVEQLRVLLIEPGAVVLARVVPIFELHHHFDALLLAHRADAEQLFDVDQSDAANLHVMPRNLVPAPDQHVVAAAREVHDVVRDEPVTPLDQVEHALALADSRPAAKQQPDAEDVGQGAVHRRAGRERVVQEWLEPPIE